MGCILRLAFLILQFAGLATIVALNVYADYKQQFIVTLVIFCMAYMAGVLYYKTEFKKDWQFLTLFAVFLLIGIFAYGFGAICLLKQFEWGTALVRDIATYQMITKPALNLTSGMLIAIIGFLFSKVDVGPEPEDYL